MNKKITAKLRRLTTLISVAGSLIAAVLHSQPAASQIKGQDAVHADKGFGTPMPQYQIFEIGVVQQGDTASQGFGASPGGVGVGRSIRSSAAQAFSWTQAGGIAGLPNLSGRAFCVSNSANDTGTVVGTCASTPFGTSRLPALWQNGDVSQLPLPDGETLGDANDVNGAGVAVGSIGGGSLQRAVVYSGGTATPITQTTNTGCFFTTAFGVNNAGRVIGPGIDPNDAARNVGMVYDIGSGSAFEVGALPGANGALPFGISNAGHIVGSSMLNQGSGLPFIWTEGSGMVAIPLPVGTTQGSARAVNSSGWAVGTASSAFAIPFVYNGSQTFRLADLIPAGTGWDLSTNTSSSALGISDGGVIVGTGVLNGQVKAYAMVPVLANVSLTGRVLTASGSGIRNVMVTVSGGDLPEPINAYTSSFGYFNFPSLRATLTYIVTVTPRKFEIAQPTRPVTATADVTGFDFIAEPSAIVR